jgi:hypothetical protein
MNGVTNLSGKLCLGNEMGQAPRISLLARRKRGLAEMSR